MRIVTISLSAFIMAMAACGEAPRIADANAGTTSAANSANGAAPAVAAAERCPDGGDRLPLTGLCRGRAVAYLDTSHAPKETWQDDCGWDVAEAALPGGDVLLYRGRACGENKGRIRYAGTAEEGTFQLVSSSLQGAVEPPSTIIRLYAAAGDPAAAITARARTLIADKAEAASCAARPAGQDSYPGDAMVIDTMPARPQGGGSGEPEWIAVCGDGGYVNEATRFWRYSQGHAWLFDYGQDMWDIDPATVTILRKGADGQWSQR